MSIAFEWVASGVGWLASGVLNVERHVEGGINLEEPEELFWSRLVCWGVEEE